MINKSVRAGNVNVSFYKTVEAIADVMDAIENSEVNYHGDWHRCGPDVQLKEVAKKKLDLLYKKLQRHA